MKRYDPTLSSDPYQSHEYAVMEEELHGEYVKHEDSQNHIAELENRKETLASICTQVDDIVCDCTITDSKAIGRLLDLLSKNRDAYILLKEKG